ncbi:MAG: DUF2249 domain-containing protein [Arachnia sp.]
MEPRTEIPLTAHQHSCGCSESDHGVPELDVRPIPHAIRHATVFGALSAIPDGGSLVLLAPHDPKPLLAQIAEREGPITVTYLQEGPDAWRLRLTRA